MLKPWPAPSCSLHNKTKTEKTKHLHHLIIYLFYIKMLNIKIKNLQFQPASANKGTPFSGYKALAHLHQVKDEYNVPDGNRMLQLVALTLEDKTVCTPRAHRAFGASYALYKQDHTMCLPDDCKLSDVICKYFCPISSLFFFYDKCLLTCVVNILGLKHNCCYVIIQLINEKEIRYSRFSEREVCVRKVRTEMLALYIYVRLWYLMLFVMLL